MAIIINDITERHAADTAGEDYGNETIINLAGGGSIRCAAYPEAVEYVRVLR